MSANPKIIISQTSVAAGARRGASTRLASSTSSEVPAALTPRPMATNDNTANARPASGAVAIQAVAAAAPKPPSARTAMPPTIHGVRRPPTSPPKPMRGRTH